MYYKIRSYGIYVVIKLAKLLLANAIFRGNAVCRTAYTSVYLYIVQEKDVRMYENDFSYKNKLY